MNCLRKSKPLPDLYLINIAGDQFILTADQESDIAAESNPPSAACYLTRHQMDTKDSSLQQVGPLLPAAICLHVHMARIGLDLIVVILF